MKEKSMKMMRSIPFKVGAKQTSVLGVSQSAKGGVGLDTMVQRLVQTAVYEIDSKCKANNVVPSALLTESLRAPYGSARSSCEPS
jgi:hypothetical protein